MLIGVGTVQEAEPPEGEGVCARVRIALDQQIAITRTAISGTLEIDNSQGAGPVESIRVQLAVFDALGADVTDRFAVSTEPTLNGVTGVTGNGVVAPGVRATANWIILPTRDAAPTVPVQYSFGGVVHYTQGGAPRSFFFTPVPLTVRPDPRLEVKYFLQREVFADDPFTSDVVEPSEPFSLGLMMSNRGFGTASNVTVTSSQPRIVENVRRLLIEFFIVGAQIGGQPVEPSLTLRLGELPPQTTKVGRYLLTTTLLGFFESFQASFRRRPDYGIDDERVALIESVSTFSLSRAVRSLRVGADGPEPDFLTDELSGVDDPNENPAVPAIAKLPDRVHLSDGSVASVASVVSASFQAIPGTSQYRLQFPPVPGYVYVTFPDPTGGQLRVATVRRADGRELPVRPAAETTSLYNVWQTRYVFRDRQRPLVEPRIHLFDDGGSGSYIVTFDTVSPPSAVTGWRSVAAHEGLGDLVVSAPVGGELGEARTGGGRVIEFTLSERINAATFTPSTVSITGRDLLGDQVALGGLTWTTEVVGDGRTGRIVFSQPLPDKARYCLRVIGLADVLGRVVRQGTGTNLTVLRGDANGDRAVNSRDLAFYRSLLGVAASTPVIPADASSVRADVNRDGVISEADVQTAAAGVGLEARYVADPCWTGLPISSSGLPVPSSTFQEFEPNQSRSQATVVTMSALDRISGSTTGSASSGPAGSTVDYFRVGAPAFPAAIYRHRLTLASAGGAGHTTAIRGFAQESGQIDAASDVPVQLLAPPRPVSFNQWYGFGTGERVLYSVAGTSQTIQPYEVTIKSEPVTPQWLGELTPGEIVITTAGQGHGTDSEILVFDRNLMPIADAMSDDVAPAGPESRHARSRFAYRQGAYFVAISDRNLADSQASPPWDLSLSQPVLDVFGAVVASSAAPAADLTFSVTDASGTRVVQAGKSGAYDVRWFVFSVGQCIPDIVGVGQVPAPDELVTADDYIAFLNAFAAGDLLADVCGIGGPPSVPDGLLTGDDFVAFIAGFADGCP